MTTRPPKAIELDIGVQFSRWPGGRYRSQGASSGQEFYEDHLLPAYTRAEEQGVRLDVQMEGVEFGYPIGFLDEAFGQLSRRHGREKVLEVLNLQYPGDVSRTIESVTALIEGNAP